MLESVCPTCKAVLDNHDLCDADDLIDIISTEIHVICKYSALGCCHVSNLQSLEQHETMCQYGRYPAKLLKKQRIYKGTPHIKKQPLQQARPQYVKRQRLYAPIKYIRDYCKDHHENVVDVLFFMLKNELELTNDMDKASSLKKLWESKGDISLSAEECLAMRVESLQSKTQYRYQYEMLNRMQEHTLKPPDQLDKAEKLFLPTSASYEIYDPVHGIDLIHQSQDDTYQLTSEEAFVMACQKWHPLI